MANKNICTVDMLNSITDYTNLIVEDNSKLLRLGLSDVELQIFNKLFPVGSVYTSSTSENPSSYLGGTWSLCGKSFAAHNSNTPSLFTPNTTNITSVNSCWMNRIGNVIRFRMNVVLATELGDSTLQIGNFDLEAIGCNAFPPTKNIVVMSDGGNGVAFAEINSDGTTNFTDVITKVSGGTIPSGANILIDFELILTTEKMLDSACSEWRWKRTA